ncbi:MAG TPA: hypothetical protein VGM08_00095 [Candidatus Saccharimonadales bacterium]|jgi:hypothetical protein
MSEQKTERVEKVEKTVEPVVEGIKKTTATSEPHKETQLPLRTEKRSKQIVLSFGRIFIVLVVLGAIVAGSLHFWHKQPATVAKQNRPISHVATSVKQKATAAQPLSLKTVDATYLPTAKLLSDQKIFADTSGLGENCTDEGDCQSISSSDMLYYQIGTTDTGDSILYIMTPASACDLAECFGAFALEKGNNYTILLATGNSDTEADTANEAQQYAKTFTPNVTLDRATKLAGLEFPDTVTVNGQTYNRRYSEPFGTFMQNGLSDIRGSQFGGGPTSVQPVSLGQVDDSHTAYKVITKDDPAFQVVENYVTFGNLFTMPYDLPNPLQTSDDKPVNVAWQSGSSKQVSLSYPPTNACGAQGYTLVKVADPSQLTAVGTFTGGQTLYQLPADNAFSKKVFTEDYANGASAADSSLQGFTERQFMDGHGYALIKDSLGEYVMVVRDDLITGGGCAKPVIYLYPQQTTNVSVRVDAHVDKSDPLYPAPNGWQNVLAQPSGQLTYQGKPYDSLYWEGQGFGAYPDITSGTVVESGQAVATIRSQLKAQGLNTKEISDFLAYWQPKLPTTPYVRLTWLSTAQMNILAPLNISPRPQTLIRVFLDFQGLQKPEKLAPQHFAVPARRGFTVVEWGGLARNGLQE